MLGKAKVKVGSKLAALVIVLKPVLLCEPCQDECMCCC